MVHRRFFSLVVVIIFLINIPVVFPEDDTGVVSLYDPDMEKLSTYSKECEILQEKDITCSVGFDEENICAKEGQYYVRWTLDESEGSYDETYIYQSDAFFVDYDQKKANCECIGQKNEYDDIGWSPECSQEETGKNCCCGDDVGIQVPGSVYTVFAQAVEDYCELEQDMTTITQPQINYKEWDYTGAGGGTYTFRQWWTNAVNIRKSQQVEWGDVWIDTGTPLSPIPRYSALYYEQDGFFYRLVTIINQTDPKEGGSYGHAVVPEQYYFVWWSTDEPHDPVTNPRFANTSLLTEVIELNPVTDLFVSYKSCIDRAYVHVESHSMPEPGQFEITFTPVFEGQLRDIQIIGAEPNGTSWEDEAVFGNTVTGTLVSQDEPAIRNDCAYIFDNDLLCNNYAGAREYWEKYRDAENYEVTQGREVNRSWLWAGANEASFKYKILYVPCADMEVVGGDGEWLSCGEGSKPNSFTGKLLSQKSLGTPPHDYMCLYPNSQGSIVECCGETTGMCYSDANKLPYFSQAAQKKIGEAVYQTLKNPSFELGNKKLNYSLCGMLDEETLLPHYWNLYCLSESSYISLEENEESDDDGWKLGAQSLMIEYNGGSMGGMHLSGIYSDPMDVSGPLSVSFYYKTEFMNNALASFQIWWYANETKIGESTLWSSPENTDGWSRFKGAAEYVPGSEQARIVLLVNITEAGLSSKGVAYFDNIGLGEGYFCTVKDDDSTTWVMGLDNTNEGTCNAASDAANGIYYAWTGSYCCGEESPEYYNDNESGCWDGVNVRSEEYVHDIEGNTLYDNVINFDGRFYGCNLDPADPLAAMPDTETPLNKLVTKQQYCSTFKSDVEGRGFYCSYDNVWKTDSTYDFDGEVSSPPYNRTFMKIRPPDYIESSYQGCCGIEECWNGTDCISNQKARPDTGATGGYICVDGTWAPGYEKFDWDEQISGFCHEDSQCLLGSEPPQCVSSDFWVKDHICDQGNWSSRTRYVALELLDYALQESPSDYVLFCDAYEKTLNDYGYPVKIDDANDYLGRANNICVLKYKQGDEEKVIFGTSLNQPIDDAQLPFMDVIGDDENCDYALSEDGNFHKCSTSRIWYNKRYELVVFGKDGISSLGELSYYDHFIDFLLNPAQKVVDLIIDVIEPKSSSGAFLPFGFARKTKDFNVMYLAEDPDLKRMTGIVESVGYDDYMYLSYENVSIDVCRSVERYDQEKLAGDITCKPIVSQDNMSLAYYTVSSTPTGISQWPEISAKLRMQEYSVPQGLQPEADIITPLKDIYPVDEPITLAAGKDNKTLSYYWDLGDDDYIAADVFGQNITALPSSLYQNDTIYIVGPHKITLLVIGKDGSFSMDGVDIVFRSTFGCSSKLGDLDHDNDRDMDDYNLLLALIQEGIYDPCADLDQDHDLDSDDLESFLFICGENCDKDGDTIPDTQDYCPFDYDPDNEDTDADSVGDICDNCTDIDNDGYGTRESSVSGCASDIVYDNCPNTFNPGQEDHDKDRLGDVCDSDSDDDGLLNYQDNCPLENKRDCLEGEDFDSGLGCCV